MNCNTTHYRANSSSVPGDPTPAITVYINEWLASNTGGGITNPIGNGLDDWFELYNPGPDTVDLSGCYLTDTSANRTQFKIPNGRTLAPGAYLLVWADNQGNANTPGDPQLHTNFRLSNGGEAIGLYGTDGLTLIDFVNFGTQTNNISQGHYPNGTGPLYYYPAPTPGAANTNPGGGGNTPPTLNPIADRIVTLGQTLAFTATATDAEAPPQTLTFSLDTPLTGLTVNGNGQVSWTPNAGQTPSTNTVTLRVTDNGVPPLHGTRTFQVRVVPPPHITAILNPVNGQAQLTFPTLPGKTYRIEYKNTLEDLTWTVVPGSQQVAPGTTLTLTDNLGAQPTRFYKLVILD